MDPPEGHLKLTNHQFQQFFFFTSSLLKRDRIVKITSIKKSQNQRSKMKLCLNYNPNVDIQIINLVPIITDLYQQNQDPKSHS